MERNRVLISGLPLDENTISKADLLIYFQSARKSGGGEVSDIEFLEQGQAIVVFENEDVAQKVLVKEHKIKGHAIRAAVPVKDTRDKTSSSISRDMDENIPSSSSSDDSETDDPEEFCVVKVSDLAPETTQDSIQNYFEFKKKSKGGPVKKVELDRSLNMAIVVFKFEQDAKNVVSYRKHKLDNSRLKVSFFHSDLKKETLSNKEKKERISGSSGEESASLEFVVTGISEKTTEDSLKNYLENTRRSGGGDLQTLTLNREECAAEVKFQDIENIDKLLTKNHTIDGSMIQIKPKPPKRKVPIDPLKVHVKGLDSTTTKNGLELYMEKMSKREVQDVQFGCYGNALVLFKEAPDFEEFAERVAIDKKGLEGKYLKLERVPYCCCLQVSGLDERTTEDAIKLHFDNEKRGCGAEPSKIELQGEGRALVYFDDPLVIDKALDKQHRLDNAELRLQMVYPFLDEENFGSDKKQRKELEAIEVQVDPNIMAHIMKNFQDELQELQVEASIELEWSPRETTAKMKRKANVRNDESWRKRIEVLQEFLLDKFEYVTISVEPSLWGEVVDVVKRNSYTKEFQDFDIITDNSANEIRIAGKKDCLQRVVSVIKTCISEIQEDKSLQDSIETKVKDNIESGKLALLKISDEYKKIQGISTYVKIEINEAKGEVIMQSPKMHLQEISMGILEFLLKIKEEVLELPERVLRVLETPEGRNFVCKSLLQHQIEAVVEHGQRQDKNEASILAISKEHARQASKLIHSFSTEKGIHLEEENIQVISTPKWKELVADLGAQCMVNIFFEAQAQTLWISGIKTDVCKCSEIVENHIEKNTILHDVVKVSDGCSRFILQRLGNEVSKIQDDMSDCFLKIEQGYGGQIRLSGTSKGIRKGKKAVMSLINKVCDKDVKVDKPGMKKFLKSRQGLKSMEDIEAERNCTVELIDMNEVRAQESDSIRGMGDMNRTTNCEMICSYTTKKGKQLIVYKDDLTRHQVDVLVNAANENLQHDGGLARALVKEGGQGIQDECDKYVALRGRPLTEGEVMETGPGRLPCKRIIHAVGPIWDNYCNQSPRQAAIRKGILRKAVENCLERAKDFQSIAIPAVSTGIFGFPLDLCANILVEATSNFFKTNPRCNLSEIHLTDIDDVTVKALTDEMRKQFGKEAGFKEAETKSSVTLSTKFKPSSETVARTTSTSTKFFSTSEGISILIKEGNIVQEKADVLVNTAAEDLDLQRNACAQSFSKAGGKQLQKFCNKIAPIKAGDIGVTKPGKLQCDYVFHAVCTEWGGGKGEKILRGILHNCLTEADERGAQSIAIPAIGTGVLEFPRHLVARVSFEEVIKFSKTRPSNLKEVKFVVYDKDQPTVQAFKREMASRLTSSTTVKTSKKISPGSLKKTPTKGGSSTLRKRKENWYELNLDNITVQVQSGDITQESTDAIVVISNPELDLEVGGGAGSAILKVGGEAVRRECEQHPIVKVGGVAMTGAGNLEVKKLIHCIPHSNSFRKEHLMEAVVDCLEYAEKNRMKSISFPAIGTGNLGMSSDECAESMLMAFNEFSQQNPSSVRLVRVVVYQEPMIQSFCVEMRAFLGEMEPDDENTGILPNAVRKIAKFVSSNLELIGLKKGIGEEEGQTECYESPEIFLRVYSDCPHKLEAAVDAITEMINKTCISLQIKNSSISDMESHHVKEISKLGYRFDCKIEVIKDMSIISLEGNNEDVLRANSAIMEILFELKETIHERKNAEVIARDVQWEHESEDGYVPYSTALNAKIEMAFNSKQSRFLTFEDEDGDESKIDFKRMIIETDGSEMKLKRKRKNEDDISLPDYWDPQPKIGATEVAFHLVDLDPNKQPEEYLTVSDRFKETLAGKVKIKKIQRVQNPTQYKTYALRKKRKDKENGKTNNERLLFHGTPKENLESINTNCFNRAYCGKNATCYGLGVYFAVNAEYSAQSNYSPPDSDGNRYMYLVRVITGEFTEGDEEMAVPPAKDPTSPTDTYDTVVDDVSDPTIFVAFYDWQYYPEYLITFQ